MMTMKKYIISLTLILFVSISLLSQVGDQAVNKLLMEHGGKSNLSKGESFSEQNEKDFISMFASQNTLIYGMGLNPDGKKQIPVYKYIELIQSTFDEESEIIVGLTNIKIKNPVKINSDKYLYKVTALQSFTAFKKDDNDFAAIDKVILEIEFSLSSNVAYIVSVEVLEETKGLFISPNLSAGLFAIKGDLASGLTGDLLQTSQVSFSFGVGVDYMFTENIGITTGFSMVNYNSSFSLSGFEQEPYRTIDKDGDEYDLHAATSDIVNDVKLKYIEIPIGIALRFGGFIVRLGVKYGIAGSSTSEFSEGSITTTGYYPKYSVTLYDIPEYGFDTYSMDGVEGSVEHKSTLSGFFELGYNAALSQKISISILGFYQTSFSSVYDSENAYLTSGGETYTSVLNVMESPKISAFGLKVGLDIKLF